MLIFINKFTQTAFQQTLIHETRQRYQDDNKGAVSPLRWLEDWVTQRIMLFAGGDDHVAVVELYTSKANCTDDNLCNDFDFCLYSVPVDKWGDVSLGDRTTWVRQFNGGLINHGTNDMPEWSMHI